jgi:hypothetical protein
VATYTRGSARLVDGEARVSLGETFRWVTNPDIGLTAHLTPRGRGAVLYVAALGTDEMVVRASADSPPDAEFDYLVYGLRLGFEEMAVVQPKSAQAFPPTAQAIEETYGGQPDLRAHSALERFRAMRLASDATADLDLSGSGELLAALEAQRAAAMAVMAESGGVGDGLIQAGPEAPDVAAADGSPGEAIPRKTDGAATAPASSAALLDQPETTALSGDGVTDLPFTTLPVSGAVRPGDVLTLDLERPGSLRLATSELDRAVAGCALDPGEDAMLPAGHAAVGVSGVVVCRADARFGSIHAGDLLTTSENPGHAMVAGEYARGAVLGKAVESLEKGTGAIKVLVILR